MFVRRDPHRVIRVTFKSGVWVTDEQQREGQGMASVDHAYEVQHRRRDNAWREMLRRDPTALFAFIEKLDEVSWGTLWLGHARWGEHVALVEVVNSSPEPDGTFKTIYLRVPPTIRTAHEAVAWTFGLHKSQYQPQVQT